MANMEIYSIDTNGGPCFEKPRTARIPYSEYTNHYAESIDGATEIVDRVLGNLGKLTNDMAELESKVNDLGDLWNTCIEIDNKQLEYVPIEDLNKDIEEMDDSCVTGKEKCDAIIAEFNEKIEEINTYLHELKANNDEYKDLQAQGAEYLTASLHPNISDDKRTEYNQKIGRINKQLENYYHIPDITFYGKWVE